jgi:hypothetical protein
MAQIFAASIYGANKNDWNRPQGVQMGFSTQNVIIREIDGGTPANAGIVVYSGVNCVSQIQLLPTAPSPIQPVYYSPLTVAALITLANA